MVIALLFTGCTVQGFDAGGKECTSQLACPDPYQCEELGAEKRLVCVRVLAFAQGAEPSPSYVGAADAFVSELTPARLPGADLTVRVDGDEANNQSNKKDVALLRWSLEDPAVPPVETLYAVAIDLQVTDPTIASFDLFPLRKNWNEAQASWSNASSSVPWEAPGASGPSDRGPTPVGVVDAKSIGRYRTWLNPAGELLIKDWLANPSHNQGFALEGDHYDAVVFVAREDKVKAAPPRLVLYFQ